MDIMKACTAFVALIWLASCQSGSERPAPLSAGAPPQRSNVIDDSKVRPPAPVVEASNPWAGRSGEAEALADLANGRPVKLYTHVYGGERAGFRSPGLLYCDPDQNTGDAAENLFASIPEANVSEGVIYTPAQQARQLAASAFAKAYNLTIFEHKRDLIVRLCPRAGLEKELAAAAESLPYRWLTTADLETLLQRSRITQPDRRESYMRTPEEFHENGHYVLHGDNYEAHGKYSFKDDAVCAQAERDPEVCRRVLVDKLGRYWIVGRYNRQVIERISVSPLR